MALPTVPNRHADSSAHRQRIAETVNGITTFQFDDSRVRTQDEITAGVTPFNYAYVPGHLYRYGTNTSPGTTDMSSALQLALDSNSEVFIPVGTHLVVTTINVPADVRITGGGYDSVLQTTATSSHSLMSLSGSDRVVIKGVRFLGNGVGTDPITPSVGVDIFQSDDVEITSCFFDAFNHDIRIIDDTVNADNCSGITIHDNHFFSAYGDGNGGYGILNVRANNTLVHDNTFGPGPFGRHCIYVSAGSTFVTVHDNVIRGCRLAGISMNSGIASGDGISRVNIHHNTILGSGTLTSFGYGINATGGITNSQISNNIIDLAANNGIYIQSADGSIVPSNLIISENTISSAQGIGIAVYDCVDCQIINNRLNNNGQNGTDITDIDLGNINATSSGNKVSGNHSTSAMRHLVVVGTGVGGTNVSDNYSTTMTRNKVQDAGNNTRICEYQDGWQTATISSGVVTLDPAAGSNVKVTLNQNVTNFTLTTYGALAGSPLNIIFTQDGTGGWTVAFDASLFATAWSNAGNTLNKVSSIRFVFDGAKFQQVGAQMAYH